MRQLAKTALVAAMLGTAIVGAIPSAQAGVNLSIGVNNRPRSAFWYGPPGPCSGHQYYYGAPMRNCGYSHWNQPIFVGGYWYHGPFYYHYRHGEPWYWWRGQWRRNEWRGSPDGWRNSSTQQWGDEPKFGK
jgi:hypothetical protein